MLDIDFIRQEPKKVKKACKDKDLNPKVVDNLLDLDQKRRDLIQKVQPLREERNKLNDQLKQEQSQELLEKARKIKSQLQDLEPQLKKVQESYQDLMLQIPNLPLDDVPVGDKNTNQVLRTWGEKPDFDFPPQDHIELGRSLKLFDLKRGAKVAGFRGYFLTNQGVKLALGLMQFALDKMIDQDFTPIIPPVINRRRAFTNSGLFPWGESEAYRLQEDETDPDNDYFLAGTSEVPLVSFYADEVLPRQDLPMTLVGFSPCYRREIGNYGKDTRGIYRVHEFLKVEQVVFCQNDPQVSQDWHEKLIKMTEKIHQQLKIPYRVVLMSTGEMGQPQAKKYDLETWMPGRNDWGEAGSDSILYDFQARRANIRYRDQNGELQFVHTLNNTALTTVRTIIALLENFQRKDGSVKLPKVLKPYLDTLVLKPSEA